ncbi:MAG: type II toxin-antitoxin system VapC family toxin [Gammaproteobacteria bacterium]|nr:type II toxin-antitoxin system VapC family toxin [Gammaproteobacteria bacterium]
MLTGMLNLDTHVLIFAVNGDLRPAERKLLSSNRWSASSIVLWELAKLVQLGRIGMNLDDREVKHVLARLHIWPIDLEIARTSISLDFRGDPADEIIAATSIVHDIPLLTRDRTIRRSRLVPLAIAAR